MCRTDRFVVVECEGYRSDRPIRSGVKPGLSVHVLDRAFNYKIVASFRSEKRIGNIGGRLLGHDGARESGRERAAELNGQ